MCKSLISYLKRLRFYTFKTKKVVILLFKFVLTKRSVNMNRHRIVLLLDMKFLSEFWRNFSCPKMCLFNWKVDLLHLKAKQFVWHWGAKKSIFRHIFRFYYLQFFITLLNYLEIDLITVADRKVYHMILVPWKNIVPSRIYRRSKVSAYQ